MYKNYCNDIQIKITVANPSTKIFFCIFATVFLTLIFWGKTNKQQTKTYEKNYRTESQDST